MKPIKPYSPDHRVADVYRKASLLDDQGLEGLCPSYTELVAAEVRYEDSIMLGRGAIKEVYKTFNNHTMRWIAMARLREGRGPEFYDLFVHEAWLTASLNHPNIITIHDAGVDRDGRPFFSMDLKGDSNLADLIREQKEDRRELLEIFMKVCDAVAYAHSKGIVHLDLKPENIQADEFGEVLVCDWGLAKLIGETEDGADEIPFVLRRFDNMTMMGEIKGSLGFMAPEQVISGGVKDCRTDVFALGCVLHLMLTGHSPFTGTPSEILDATRNGRVTPPRGQYPDQHIPEALEAVIMKATAALPDERYDSAKMLRDEIFNFLSGHSTVAEKPGFFREARLFLARNRLPVTITVCSIIALSVVSVLFIQDLKQQQRETALERERATEFEAKAETASTLYHDVLERSEEDRIQLARKLATSASDLKKLGVFIRPVETVREARKLLDSAFALDPDCASARLQQFSLDCITLNFKHAFQNPVTPDSDIADYLLFVTAFSGFEFSETDRPTVEQLSLFLQQVKAINDGNRRALIERMVAYDHAARVDKDGYVEVVESLLRYINEPGDDLDLEYNAETSCLSLHSAAHTARLCVRDQWGSNECLLRFIPFRVFRPEVGIRFYLRDLHNLQIESLDLRGCKEVVLNRSADLPMLRTITIRPGQLDVEKLRSVIKTNEEFEIIED